MGLDQRRIPFGSGRRAPGRRVLSLQRGGRAGRRNGAGTVTDIPVALAPSRIARGPGSRGERILQDRYGTGDRARRFYDEQFSAATTLAPPRRS